MTVRTDHRGHRTGSSHDPQADRRVLLLEGSFSAALQVEYSESLAGVMETKLFAALGESVLYVTPGSAPRIPRTTFVEPEAR